MIVLRAAVMFVLVSCGAPAPETPPTEPTPAAPVSRCDEIAARFLAAVSAGTGECTSRPGAAVTTRCTAAWGAAA